MILVVIYLIGVTVSNVILELLIKLIVSSSPQISLALIKFILIFVSVAWLLCTVTFLTFSSFFLIYKNLSIIKSFKESVKFVNNNYFSVLAILIVFCFIWILVSYLSVFVIWGLSLSELLSTIILYPYFFVVLSEFLYNRSDKK